METTPFKEAAPFKKSHNFKETSNRKTECCTKMSRLIDKNELPYRHKRANSTKTSCMKHSL